jgi:hypothetical protein
VYAVYQLWCSEVVRLRCSVARISPFRFEQYERGRGPQEDGIGGAALLVSTAQGCQA